MVHRHAVRRQQLVDDGKVVGQVLQAHVLEHAHAGDAVELARHVAVVLQADLDQVRQAGRRHALARQRILVFRQGHAHAAGAILLCGTDDERTPAAADVEQGLARLQLDFLQDMVDLLDLRLRQRFIAMFEIGTGIHESRVEKLFIKRVRHVVVVADGFGILALVVRKAAHDAGQLAFRFQGIARQGIADGNHVHRRALDLNIAFHVGRAQIGQRGVQQIAGRGDGRQADRDSGRLAGQVDMLAVPQFYAQRQGGLAADTGDPGLELVLYKQNGLQCSDPSWGRKLRNNVI